MGDAVPFDELPKGLQSQLGASSTQGRRDRMTAWKDVPTGDGWKVCKPHGLAWRGDWPCCYCEDPPYDGP